MGACIFGIIQRANGKSIGKRKKASGYFSEKKMTKRMILKPMRQIHKEKGRKKKTRKVSRAFLTYLFNDGTILKR